MSTAKDIAARLNLSVSTIGRALADDPRISESTKARVREAADELGYVTNDVARMMRGVRSTAVGLVIPDVRNSFYATAAHALTVAMRDHDHQVMLCETGDDPETELRQIRDLISARIAGVVLVPSAHPHDDVRRLLASVPHVQFNRRVPKLPSPWFGLDDRGAIALGTQHLLDLGHRRLCYIGGHRDISTGADRLAGFRATLSSAGLPLDEARVDLGRPSDADHGGDALRRALGADIVPTAIVTGGLRITAGVLAAMHEDGVDAPRDVSVVGLGDDPGFAWWGAGLTTIAPPVHELATACGIWLLRQLETPDELNPPDDLRGTSAATLIVRGSTAHVDSYAARS